MNLNFSKITVVFQCRLKLFQLPRGIVGDASVNYYNALEIGKRCVAKIIDKNFKHGTRLKEK